MTTADLQVQVARQEERLAGLEKWQRAQNGTLSRLEEKIERVHSKIDRILWGLLGMSATVVIALGLQVILLLSRR